MKKLTFQSACIALIIIAFSATDAFAQKTIKLDANGKAKISATIKPWKVEEMSSGWKISGKQFSTLQIKQTNSGKFKYEIRRGNEFLSSGHTTGSNIQIQSDRKSTYTITIINKEDKPRKIELSMITDTGEQNF